MKLILAVIFALLGVACLGVALNTIFTPFGTQLATAGDSLEQSAGLSGFMFALPLAVFFFVGAWWLTHQHKRQQR